MIVRAAVLSVLGAMLVVSPADAAPAKAAAPTCGSLAATIVGTPQEDRLFGTPGRDVIQALAGNDRIFGVGGDDLLCGGEGSDLLDGGRGDDTLRGGLDQLKEDRAVYTIGDRLRGGAGDDHFRGGVDPRPVDSRFPDEILLGEAKRGIVFDGPAGVVTGQGQDTVSHQAWRVNGSRFDDHITGGSGGDYFDGDRGDDDLLGGAGADILIGSRGHDHLDGSTGSDTLIDDAWAGGAGDDMLEGGAGSDSLEAGRGSDVLRGGPGVDYLRSYQSTPDQLYGGGGDDVLSDTLDGSALEHLDGGTGANRISVALTESPDGEVPDYKGTVDMTTGAATLIVDEEVVAFVLANADSLGLAHGRWTVTGTDQDDEIMAWGRARLYLDALAGDDSVQGGPRNDNLTGGPGRDYVWPGKGVDTCVGFEVQGQPCERP